MCSGYIHIILHRIQGRRTARGNIGIADFANISGTGQAGPTRVGEFLVIGAPPTSGPKGSRAAGGHHAKSENIIAIGNGHGNARSRGRRRRRPLRVKIGDGIRTAVVQRLRRFLRIVADNIVAIKGNIPTGSIVSVNA